MKNLYKRWLDGLTTKLRRRFAARDEAEDIAYAIEKILRVPANEARAAAEAGKSRRSEIFRLCQSEQPAKALRSLRRMPLPFDLSKLSAGLSGHADSSYLLSLPLTISSVLLLARLTENKTRQFRFLSTPLARAYLRPLVEAGETGRVTFMSSTEMLKHNRERSETSSEAVTYVTFPDHQSTHTDTMWSIPFMGGSHRFSTIEPLLFFRGVGSVFTLSIREEDEPNDLRLVKYEGHAKPQAVAETEMRAVLEWLALQLETVFRKSAPDVLSWQSAYARSAIAMAQTAVMKLKTVEGYIHMWEDADASFDRATYTWAVEELRKLQETMNNSVAPKRAAHLKPAPELLQI